MKWLIIFLIGIHFIHALNETSFCNKLLCMHGGSCHKDSNGEEFCKCPDRFYGNTCDRAKPNPCDGNLCKNSGKCHTSEDYNSYSCQCVDDFRGLFCEYNKSMCFDAKCLAKRCPDEEYCLKEYANGICNPECNSAACGWDGGDCTTKHDVLSDNLVLTLITDPRNFVEHVAPKLLMIVSQLLHVSARYQLDNDGFPMIYEWSSTIGQGSLIKMETTTVISRHNRYVKGQKGVMVYLRLDTSVCEQLSSLNNLLHVETHAVNGEHSCFTDAKLAANMITTETNQEAFTQLGVAVYDAQVQPRKAESSSSYLPYILICVFGSILFAIGAVNIASHRPLKRKHVRVSGVYYPPPDDDYTKNPQEVMIKSSHQHNGLFDRQSLLSDLSPTSLPSLSGVYSINVGEPIAKRYRQDPPLRRDVFTLLHQYASASEPITREQIETPEILSCAKIADSDGRTCIHWAVESVKEKSDAMVIEDIKKLVSIGCPLNAQDDTGATALHFAIRSNRKDVAMFLLGKIDVNIPDDDGRTALYDAVATKSLDIVERILRINGVDVNALAYTNDTPLIKCCRLGDEMLPFVELLLKHPKILVDKTAEKFATHYNGKSAMHEAAACNSIQIMKSLVSKGAAVSGLDAHQNTPLFLAVKSNQLPAVSYLIHYMKLSKDEINTPNDCNETPMEEATKRGFIEIEKVLRNARMPPHQIGCSLVQEIHQVSSPIQEVDQDSSSVQEVHHVSSPIQEVYQVASSSLPITNDEQRLCFKS